MFHLAESRLIFEAVRHPGWLAGSVVLLLAAAVLMVWLLRYERQLVSRQTGLTLLLLRLGVLSLLLLIFLQPVRSRTVREEDAGRILIAVDLSESMLTRDRHAPPGEKLGWARAAGLVGGGEVDERLDRWQQDWAAGNEPRWVADDETDDPARRAELEQARRQLLEQTLAQVDDFSRAEIARRLLTSGNESLLKRLNDVAVVELAVFAGEAQAVGATGMSAAIAETPPAVRPQVTSLAAALAAAEAAEGDGTVRGIVLLTDGRDTSSAGATEPARRLAARNVPVYSVLLGSRDRPKDLSIRQVESPASALLDDTVDVRVQLGTAGFEGEVIRVVLEAEGLEPQEREVAVQGPLTDVRFALDSTETGRREYTVRTEVQEGETRDDNNERTFPLTIVDGSVRVLLVEGEGRWEFRFLDNALTRDENVDVRRVVYRQPFLRVLPEPFFPRTLSEAAREHPDDSPFAEADLVVLGDVAPHEFDAAAWEQLERHVVDEGGTVVLLAGREWMPRSHQSQALARMLPVEQLVPIEIRDASAAMAPPSERGFRLRLTPEGEQTTFLQFDTDPVVNREIWARLPGHLWGLRGTALPTAVVLARSQVPQKGENPLAADRSNALIVRRQYGFGQVVWIGIDSTWRWRHRVGDRFHHRFWGQLARWATENRAAAGNETVRFGPASPDAEDGDAVVFRATWSQGYLRLHPGLTARVDLFRREAGGDQVAVGGFTLSAQENRPLVHEGQSTSLPEGEYLARLTVENGDPAAEPVEATLSVGPRRTPELTDVSSDRQLPDRIALLTGGRVLLPEEAGTLPELLAGNGDEEIELREDVQLWDHWLLLVGFFVLMTTEWVVRKLHGLP